mmetsp:Transcript_3114/g.5655  ORF Transcript_3114/g.5655 Transcript_3114/m.5655 type:complete len:223 (+) Transcript_3114:1250-1918(+)
MPTVAPFGLVGGCLGWSPPYVSAVRARSCLGLLAECLRSWCCEVANAVVAVLNKSVSFRTGPRPFAEGKATRSIGSSRSRRGISMRPVPFEAWRDACATGSLKRVSCAWASPYQLSKLSFGFAVSSAGSNSSSNSSRTSSVTIGRLRLDKPQPWAPPPLSRAGGTSRSSSLERAAGAVEARRSSWWWRCALPSSSTSAASALRSRAFSTARSGPEEDSISGW